MERPKRLTRRQLEGMNLRELQMYAESRRLNAEEVAFRRNMAAVLTGHAKAVPRKQNDLPQVPAGGSLRERQRRLRQAAARRVDPT